MSIKRVLQNTSLVVVSVLLMLAIGEYGLRMYRDFLKDAIPSRAESSDSPIADRQLDTIALPQGVDRTWFRQDPPKVAQERREVSQAAAELHEAYHRRGVYPAQSSYVWNKVFVDKHVCVKNDYVFGNYGDLASNLRVFIPHDGEQYPRYRFPPNTLTPEGLRINKYGFRGPELPSEKKTTTIRIAFLGASTTIASHSFPFSYPEHLGYWLNLWLKANNYPLQVETINAGREGIGSSDIAAIFEQEVLPLAPDYVIYYEGANHLSMDTKLVDVEGTLHPYPGQELFPKEWVRRSALLHMIDGFYGIRVVPILTEWRRPHSRLIFPDGVNESEPDIRRNDLPINLSIILSNLHRIATLSQKAGVRFLVSSFVWLSGDEPEIIRDRSRHVEILSQVNHVFWPLLPKDVRRLVDFQNRVFEQFTAAYKLGFLDIAGAFPRDPDLFTDAIHFTPEGVRMQAWVVLAQFLPYLVRDLESGYLANRQRPTMVFSVFSPTTGELYDAKCSPSQSELEAAHPIPLSAMRLAYEGSSLTPSAVGLVARSAPIPWAYIAQLPLEVDCGADNQGGWIGADIKVAEGTIAIGVLNDRGDDFIVRSMLKPSKEFQRVFLRLTSFKGAADLIIQNGDEHGRSEGVVRQIQVIGTNGAMVGKCQLRGSRISA